MLATEDIDLNGNVTAAQQLALDSSTGLVDVAGDISVGDAANISAAVSVDVAGSINTGTTANITAGTTLALQGTTTAASDLHISGD